MLEMDSSSSSTPLIERWRYEEALSEINTLQRENRHLRILSITAWEIGKEAALLLDNLRLSSGSYLAEVEPLDNPDGECTRGEMISPVSPGVQLHPDQVAATGAGDEQRNQLDLAGKRAHPLAEQRKKLDDRLERLRKVRKRRLDELEQKLPALRASGEHKT